MKRVLIEPADYRNVNLAVDRVFDCFPLPMTGKKVLIKPNVLRASEANEGIVTPPGRSGSRRAKSAAHGSGRDRGGGQSGPFQLRRQ